MDELDFFPYALQNCKADYDYDLLINVSAD